MTHACAGSNAADFVPKAYRRGVCYITYVLVLSDSRSEAVWRTGVWAKSACCAVSFWRLSGRLRGVRAPGPTACTAGFCFGILC